MPGRNDPCSCGSGKKFKRCCLRKGEDKIPKNNGIKEIVGSDKVTGTILTRLAVSAWSGVLR